MTDGYTTVVSLLAGRRNVPTACPNDVPYVASGV
jgi:hypothetical protein